MSIPAALFLEQAAVSPHIHFVYDLQTQRVVSLNAAYHQLLQGNRDHIDKELPALLRRLHPDDVPLWRRYWLLWQRGDFRHEVEVRLTRAEQPEQWFCLTPYWHQDAAGHRWVSGSLREITTDKMQRLTSDKFNAKKNTALEILSHDLAGAFIMLQQLTEYVQEEMEEPANPQVSEMLALMRKTSQQSVAMIHDLVDQEFLESASIPLKRARVDLGEKIQESLDPFRRAPGQEQRQLVWTPPATPVYAEVDAAKLLQVVTNLVHNALKFTPDEGHVTVSLEPGDTSVRIIIADEGIGIPAALQPQLFERFTPARRPGLRGEPTTGLGLSLCRVIVTLHGGTLTVDSTEGQGTTFTIELPVTAPTPA